MSSFSIAVLFIILTYIKMKAGRGGKLWFYDVYSYGFYFAFAFLISEVLTFTDFKSALQLHSTFLFHVFNFVYAVMVMIWFLGPYKYHQMSHKNIPVEVSHPMSMTFFIQILSFLLLGLSFAKAIVIETKSLDIATVMAYDSILSMILLGLIAICYWINAHHIYRCFSHFPAHSQPAINIMTLIMSDDKSRYLEDTYNASFECYKNFAKKTLFGAGLFMFKSDFEAMSKEVYDTVIKDLKSNEGKDACRPSTE